MVYHICGLGCNYQENHNLNSNWNLKTIFFQMLRNEVKIKGNPDPNLQLILTEKKRNKQ